nr:putative phospholipase a2 [Quercus suber]
MSSWFTGWNPIKYFPEYTGPHAVGTVDVEIPVADLPAPSDVPEDAQPTIAFRIFYPCIKPSSKELDRPVRWIPSPQRETMASFAKFLGLREKMAGAISYLPQQLYWIKLPAHRNAKLLDPPTSNDRWPVTVFSHGLAGSRNAYSQICGDLASNGVIVIALDHRDGSSPIQYVRATTTTEAHIVNPVKIPHNPVTQEVYDGRDKQLRLRLWEIAMAYEALMKIDAGEEVENLDSNTSRIRKERVEVLWQFADMLDIHRPGKVTWAGHSFGAATTVQLLKSIFYHKERTVEDGRALIAPKADAAIIGQIMPESPTLLLDMWGLPLQSPDQKFLWDRPLPSYTVGGPNGSNVLSVLSEAFQNWEDNLNINKHIVAEPSRSRRPSIAPRLTREKGRLLPPWARLRAPSPSSDSGYVSEISRTSMSLLSRQRSRASMMTSPSSTPSNAVSSKSSPERAATAGKTEGPHMFYTQMSQHFNQSDFGVLFPWIAKRVTKAEEPERVIELNTRAMVQVLRENGIEVSGEDDKAILDKNGGLRRWINIPLSEDQATNRGALETVNRKLSITSMKSVAPPRPPPRESMTMGQRTMSYNMEAQLEMQVPNL